MVLPLYVFDFMCFNEKSCKGSRQILASFEHLYTDIEEALLDFRIKGFLLFFLILVCSHQNFTLLIFIQTHLYKENSIPN